MIDPPATDAAHASGTANRASARSVDNAVDFDVRRASALATALEALLVAGAAEHARPIARELAALLRAADAAQAAPIVDLVAARAKRGG